MDQAKDNSIQGYVMYRALIFAVASGLAAATAAYAAPPAANTPPTKTGDPRDRLVCRSHTETGSLARITRTCKTQREWDADAADIRGSAGPSINSCRQSGQTGGC
jgi:hypothetical protein